MLFYILAALKKKVLVQTVVVNHFKNYDVKTNAFFLISIVQKQSYN